MITNRDTLVAAMAGGFQTWMGMSTTGQTGSATPLAAFTTSWFAGNRVGAVPASVGTPALCTGSTAGALPLPALTAGNQFYIGNMSAWTNTGPTPIVVLDRLSHVKLDATITTAQTFSLTRPARSSSPIGVMAFLEFPTISGTPTTIPQLNVSYTNENGVAGRTGYFSNTTSSYSQPATGASPGVCEPMQLQLGDRGVASIQSVTAQSTLASTFSYLVVLARPVITTYNLFGVGSVNLGFYDIGGIGLGADPCLYMHSVIVTAVGVVNASVRIIQG